MFMRKVILSITARSDAMGQQNHVCSLYAEIKAALKTYARTMALFTVAGTLSLSAKLLEDSFPLTNKACIVKILGFVLFFSLAQFSLMLTLQWGLTLHFIIADIVSMKHQHLDYPEFTGNVRMLT